MIAQFQSLLGPKFTLLSFEKLFGEASYRQYFRLHSDGGDFIVMQIPAGMQSVSEEISNQNLASQELPFLNIARYLERGNILSPKVLHTNLERGLILLEDLGDLSFEKKLLSLQPSEWPSLYRQALALLIKIQKLGDEQIDPDCFAFQRKFDPKLLLWEFEHFLEFGIEDRFNPKIPANEREAMMAWGEKLCGEIYQIPTGLTHRDFQSRNLMFHQDQLYLIDFQDALQGPPQYDLVALLRDSYVSLDYAMVENLLRDYLKMRVQNDLPELETQSFFENFHRVTLQRKLKDTGRFQFIFTKKNNPNFLPHVPSSLAYVRDAFARLPQYSELQDLLSRYLPELKK